MTRALTVVGSVVGCLAGCLAGCLTGCAAHSADPTPGQCGGTFGCEASMVCTRDGMCLPPDQVRSIHITWTVSGAPASATSCTAAPDLLLELSGADGLHLGFEPVPCAEGKFSVDRLATGYDEVQLGRTSSRAQLERASIDAAGNAVLNLPY